MQAPTAVRITARIAQRSKVRPWRIQFMNQQSEKSCVTQLKVIL